MIDFIFLGNVIVIALTSFLAGYIFRNLSAMKEAHEAQKYSDDLYAKLSQSYSEHQQTLNEFQEYQRNRMKEEVQ
ncbi:MAG: hypothetical protein ACHQUC_08425 [Chlamydiales bacterium]